MIEKERQEGRNQSAGLGAASLRFCLSAGAILSADLARRFEESTGVPMVDIYGATEASTAITANGPEGLRAPGSCGVPISGLDVRIVDPLTGQDCSPAREGELIARGPSIMLGYHNRPAETAETLRDGWYYSGDLARFDANNYITITGRVKDILIRGGENIAPAEIEQVVLEHPGVLDCAIVGQPDARLGEVPVLFLVPMAGDAGVDVEAVLAHCRERLSPFKVPAEVQVVDEIPRTGSGKIKRFKLLEQLHPAAEAGPAG